MPGPQPKLHLPFAQWPEVDKLLWQQAIANDDPFSDAPGARLAKTTLHSRWMAWRRFLGFMTITEPDALNIAPKERLAKERVRRFTKHLAETNTPYSVACRIDALYGAARTMFPEVDWVWLRAVKARLFALAPPGGATGPVITSVQLVELGLKLMEESNLKSNTSVSMADAIAYRDGLMIALLGHVPLRHKNLAALEIGRDFVMVGERWCIVVPPADSKTKIELDYPVPDILQEPFSIYFSRVRPRMLRRANCNALWVSPKGGPLSYSAVGPVVTRHTTDRLGIRITPHDARDAAATTWAIAAPDQIGVARDLLGHSDLRTTTKHYNRARGIEASRAHYQLIARLRGRHVPKRHLNGRWNSGP
jgi:integrase